MAFVPEHPAVHVAGVGVILDGQDPQLGLLTPVCDTKAWTQL